MQFCPYRDTCANYNDVICRTEIEELQHNVDGFQTLKRASLYLLGAVARGSNEDINKNFVAFASYFRRIN